MTALVQEGFNAEPAILRAATLFTTVGLRDHAPQQVFKLAERMVLAGNATWNDVWELIERRDFREDAKLAAKFWPQV